MNFEDEIRKIAEWRNSPESSSSDESPMSARNSELKKAFGSLFNLAKRGARIYNEAAGRECLSAQEISEEILGLMLNSSGTAGGFCVIGADKFAIILFTEPNDVVALGKKKGGSDGIFKNARQLIKLSVIKSDGGFALEDNSASHLKPEELIIHVIRWVAS